MFTMFFIAIVRCIQLGGQCHFKCWYGSCISLTWAIATYYHVNCYHFCPMTANTMLRRNSQILLHNQMTMTVCIVLISDKHSILGICDIVTLIIVYTSKYTMLYNIQNIVIIRVYQDIHGNNFCRNHCYHDSQTNLMPMQIAVIITQQDNGSGQS